MKKTIKATLFLFVLMFSTSVFGQTDDNEKMPAAERAQRLTEWMKTNLNLTAEQEQQVAPINLDCATKIDSVRNLKLSKMDKLKEARKIQQYREAEFAKILSAEQMKKYKEEKKEKGQQMKERRRQKN